MVEEIVSWKDQGVVKVLGVEYAAKPSELRILVNDIDITKNLVIDSVKIIREVSETNATTK